MISSKTLHRFTGQKCSHAGSNGGNNFFLLHAFCSKSSTYIASCMLNMNSNVCDNGILYIYVIKLQHIDCLIMVLIYHFKSLPLPDVLCVPPLFRWPVFFHFSFCRALQVGLTAHYHCSNRISAKTSIFLSRAFSTGHVSAPCISAGTRLPLSCTPFH